MDQINFVGAMIGGVAAFFLGGLWYSPLLFGNTWAEVCGLTSDQIKTASVAGMIGKTLPLSILASLVFAAFLGREIDIVFGASAGVAAGLFWVTGSLGINYAFEQKPFKLFLINGGYHTVQFGLYGTIIGATNSVF